MPDTLTAPSPGTVLPTALSVVAAATVVVAGPSVAAAGAATAIVVLAHVAGTDARTHRVPNGHLAGAAVVLGAAAIVTGSSAPTTVAVTSAGWGGVLLAVHLLDSSLGFGDVKLGFVVGAALGLVGHAAGWTLPAVLLASATAFIAGALITLAWSRRAAGATPFAPGLVVAAVGAAVVISIGGAIS